MTDKEQQGEIIIYEGSGGKPRVFVRIENDTVWLTQLQLAELFATTKANISLHVKNIFEEAELTKGATVKEYLTVQKEGDREVSRNIDYYNLSLIIAVGYRVKSTVATHFRQWATVRLNEYIVKGFTMDDERLKESGGGSYWKELLDRIRDIRSSEKVLYRQVLDLYATSIDYDSKSTETIKFFKTVQNKLHYATNKHTAAETIHGRVDAKKDFLGLETFTGQLPTKSEAKIAKNYLTEDELFRLNRLVSAFFDLAEIKAHEQKKMRMQDWVEELDKFAGVYGKGLLTNAGKISHDDAITKAEEEYKKYQVKILSPVEEAYLDTIKMVQKKIEKKAGDKEGSTKNTHD